jgi:rhamnosyltransferase subunit B
MHVLLHPVGSHGDVHPLVGLGVGLRDRGHRVTLVTAEPFRPLAERCGFAFAPVGTAADYQAAVNDPDLWHRRRSARVIFQPDRFARGLRDGYQQMAERVVPADTVVVATTLGFAGRLANEKLGVPLVTAHLQPSVLWSVADPPFRPLRWVPPMGRRLLYRAADAALRWWLFDPVLTQVRADLGLPPVRRVWGCWKDSPDRQLGLFPRWFADAPDWPATLRLTGFVRYDGGHADLPPAVERFLDAGDPPVVVTFGSAMPAGRAPVAAAAEAVRRLGRRLLILAKGAGQAPLPSPDSLHADAAPYSRVFPRAAAVVHHGGIGTTAQVLAAGVPQLVVPLVNDQPDNAARLRRLGVARVVPPGRFTADRVARELADLLGSADVRHVADRCRAWSADGDPVAVACDWVEAAGCR